MYHNGGADPNQSTVKEFSLKQRMTGKVVQFDICTRLFTMHTHSKMINAAITVFLNTYKTMHGKSPIW